MTPTMARRRLRLVGRLRNRPWIGYGLAAVLSLVALGLRLAVGAALPPGFPFLTFFPAIIITSYVAGARPGLLALVLSLVTVRYYLLQPTYELALSPGNAMALAFFLLVGLVDIAIIEAMHQALDRLRLERRRNRDLYEQQKTLFEELQHRVANNLAFVAGLLRLQKRAIAADPSRTPMVFDEAVARIETMGRIHRRLYDPTSGNAAIGGHLKAVCAELLSAMGADRVTLDVAVDGLQLAPDRLLPLSLLVAEIITNSVKHGFDGSGGEIRISRDGEGADQALIIRDNGRGLTTPPDGNTRGLGIRIVQGLAAQLGGSVSWSSDGGTVARVSLPAT